MIGPLVRVYGFYTHNIPKGIYQVKYIISLFLINKFYKLRKMALLGRFLLFCSRKHAVPGFARGHWRLQLVGFAALDVHV
jgi:hypothetical protein